MPLLLLLGRQRARDASILTLQREIDAYLRQAGRQPGAITVPRSYSDADDIVRSNWASAGSATLWSTQMGKALAEGADELEAHRRATLALQQRARIAATTETASAFNLERQAAARAITGKAKREGFVPFKRWDNTGDNVCEHCMDLGGTMVPADEDFPDGEPGNLHPNCRCITTIVLLPWWEAVRM